MPPKCPVCSSFKDKYLRDNGDVWECGCGYAIVKLNKSNN